MLFWEVVGKINFSYNFCQFLPIFGHFYVFGAFLNCTVGAFWAIFPIFLRFVGIFWGTPANYFADFGAILAIFDHFWAIFGPFLGRKKIVFFCRKMAFWPRYKAQKTEAQKTEIL